MSKTYTARLAEAIRETLPANTEFVLECRGSAHSYLFVRHPNGVHTFITPWASDKRGAVTEDVVQEALRSIARKLLPQGYFAPPWQVRNREAHSAWVAQTGIEL